MVVANIQHSLGSPRCWNTKGHERQHVVMGRARHQNARRGTNRHETPHNGTDKRVRRLFWGGGAGTFTRRRRGNCPPHLLPANPRQLDLFQCPPRQNRNQQKGAETFPCFSPRDEASLGKFRNPSPMRGAGSPAPVGGRRPAFSKPNLGVCTAAHSWYARAAGTACPRQLDVF